MTDLTFRVNTLNGAQGGAFRVASDDTTYPGSTGHEHFFVHSSGGVKYVSAEVYNSDTVVFNNTGSGNIIEWQGVKSGGGIGTLISVSDGGRGRFNYKEANANGTPVAAGGITLPILTSAPSNPTAGLMYILDNSGSYSLRIARDASNWTVYTLA